MTPPKWVPALSTIGAWLLAALVVIVVLVGVSKLLCRKPPQPVHVSPVKPGVDTLVLHDTTPGQVRVVVDRDSLIALEKKVQALTDEKESWVHQVTDLSQQLVAVDSQWARRFDSIAGMISVQYRRGRIDAVQFFRPKYVLTSSAGTWRNTWTLRATPGGGIKLVTRRLPFDLGAQLSLDGWTTFNATKFGGLASACLTMRTSEYLSGRAGVGWQTGTGPVIVAGAKLGVQF